MADTSVTPTSVFAAATRLYASDPHYQKVADCLVNAHGKDSRMQSVLARMHPSQVQASLAAYLVNELPEVPSEWYVEARVLLLPAIERYLTDHETTQG